MTVERSVFSLDAAFDAVLDMRNAKVCHALSLDNAPLCFLDRDVARATAHFVRRTSAAQALLVPATGFLDDPERWRLVVFLEKLPPDPTQFISAVIPRGPLR